MQVVLEILKLRRLFFKEGENLINLVYNCILTGCILGRMQCQFISSSFSPASSDKGTYVMPFPHCVFVTSCPVSCQCKA